MRKKAIISVGGTAGHLIPAQETAESLLNSGWEVVFLGKGLKSNHFFNKNKFDFLEISSATFGLKNPFNFLKSSICLLRGCLSAYRIMKKLNPNVILGFGSYHSFPALLVGKFMRIPLVLHEQNLVPGRVNRLMGRFSKGIGVVFPEARLNVSVPVKAVTTKIKTKFENNKNCKAYENLSPNKLTVLVFGGSQGSEVINYFMLSVLPDFKKRCPDLQIIHLIGNSKRLKQEAITIYEKASIPCVVKDFEKDMQSVMQFSDIAICRAGSGTIQELIENKLPAILIPYPGAYGHQNRNAEFFTKVVQGGIFIKQHELNREEFIEKLTSLTCHEMLDLKRCFLRDYEEKWNVISFISFIENLLSEKKSNCN